MKIAITGAQGFLGWHLRCRLHAHHPTVETIDIDLAEWGQLNELVTGCDAIIHLAGINRASDEEVNRGNVELAKTVAEAAIAGGVKRVAYANSIQAGNGTPYGMGKLAASQTLATRLSEAGIEYVDVLLPNLFGEHGRPNYNSFVATFVAKAIAGENPDIQDRPIDLLHAQDAAQAFIDAVGLPRTPHDTHTLPGGPVELSNGRAEIRPKGHPTSVLEVWHKLRAMADCYPVKAEFPDLSTKFDVNLFNTFRAQLFPQHYPIALNRHEDDRGWLVETVRAHSGQAQTFVSTTKPGITRGEHFHVTKIERFCVLQGKARISLRKVLSTEVIDFEVTGEAPAVVDMPALWTHNITNIGDEILLTQFFTHEMFDPDRPDTFWEKVRSEPQKG